MLEADAPADSDADGVLELDMEDDAVLEDVTVGSGVKAATGNVATPRKYVLGAAVASRVTSPDDTLYSYTRVLVAA